MFKKVFQQGHSERKAETCFFQYVEDLSDARTKLEAFFNIRNLGNIDQRLKLLQDRRL